MKNLPDLWKPIYGKIKILFNIFHGTRRKQNIPELEIKALYFIKLKELLEYVELEFSKCEDEVYKLFKDEERSNNYIYLKEYNKKLLIPEDENYFGGGAIVVEEMTNADQRKLKEK